MDYPYLKKAKNTIKTKRSLVFFSLFISAIIRWSASLLFQSRLFGCWLDDWLGHRWYSVNGFKDCCRLVRVIFIEQADKLYKMLNG